MPVPYVVGQWVRGERFYGREALLAEILEGPRNWIWLLGTRRIGKTSLLKQLEWLTAGDGAAAGYVPVFWDFQGAEDPSELALSFHDALLDAEERLGELGVELSEVEDDDLFASLSKLRRRLRSADRRLLLLCDEVEELIGLERRDPALLRKLRRAMQSHDDVRSVLASTIKLWELAAQRADTSPFLHGFAPPLYLASMTVEAATALVRQDQLPEHRRPRLPEEAVAKIGERCDRHPYLLQLVAKRSVETGDVDEAIEQVATDDMVRHFFAVDFEMLTPEERSILRELGAGQAADSATLEARLETVSSTSLSSSLLRLDNLGYLRRDAGRRYRLANSFFQRWLTEQPQERRDPESDTETVAMKRAPWIDERYMLLRLAGEGATGLVFLAYDTLLKTRIAVKLLKAEYAASPQLLERFRQEIVLSRDLAHPNILRVYHLGESEGRKYITMQWVDGPTLAEVIAERAPLPEPEVLTLGSKVASALQAAHGRGILHRDLKPQNILIGEAGEPLLTDFGLARLLDAAGITAAGMFVGTPAYVSPEQASLGRLDERSDLYALGVVLFEMATGRRPFEGESAGEVLELQRTARPPVPRELHPEISEELSELILECLEKERERRIPTAAAVRLRLESLQKQAT